MSRDRTQDSANGELDDASRLLTTEELAELLQVPITTLYAWRYHSKGPPAIRVGRHLRYPTDGVRSWLYDAESDVRGG